MTSNPLINAGAAVLYIVGVVWVLTLMERIPSTASSDNVIGVMVIAALLSLFTLSVATMGYLFFFQPLRLYMNGEKETALTLFLQTLGIFAGITAVLFFVLLSGVLD